MRGANLKFFLKLGLSLILAFFLSKFLVEKVVFPSAPTIRPTFKKQLAQFPENLKSGMTKMSSRLLASRNPNLPLRQSNQLPPPVYFIPPTGAGARAPYQYPTKPPFASPTRVFDYPTAAPRVGLPTSTPSPFTQYPSPTPLSYPTPTSVRPSPTPIPFVQPAEPGPPLSTLLAEINNWRRQAGTQPLTFTPQAGIEGMNQYLADLAPHLIQEGSCHHGINEKLGWDYVKQAGYNGSPHGEVLMCPGLCNPSYVAKAWWENGSGPHKQILYDDNSISSVACGYYQWNGQQAMMWGCVTYAR